MRLLLLALAALLTLTGCGEDHTGEHCVHTTTITTYVMVGKVMVPIMSTDCDQWEKNDGAATAQ